MMIDVTAALMGDPSTAFRRNPSRIEMIRDCHEIKWGRTKLPAVSKRKRYVKTSIMWTMKPGDKLLRETKGKAVYLYQKLVRHGFFAEMEKNRDGAGYFVTRTA